MLKLVCGYVSRPTGPERRKQSGFPKPGGSVLRKACMQVLLRTLRTRPERPKEQKHHVGKRTCTWFLRMAPFLQGACGSYDTPDTSGAS